MSTLYCSSWLNWIGAKFAALRYIALNGTGHRPSTTPRSVITFAGITSMLNRKTDTPPPPRSVAQIALQAE